MLPRVRRHLSKPKTTFSRIGQIVFTFKEITKLLFRVDRKFMLVVFVLNAIWGFSSIPIFYLEKLVLDRIIANIGNPEIEAAMWTIGGLLGLTLLLELGRTLLSRVTRYRSRTLSNRFNAKLEILIGQKMAELDLATIENPDFKDKFQKIEREAVQRAFELVGPIAYMPNYLIGFLSAIGILILLHPLVALGVFLFSLPQFFVDSKFIKKEYELTTELSPKRRIWGWLIYYLIRNRDFMEMKILNLADFMSGKLEKIQDEVLTKQIALRRQREISSSGSLIPLTIFEFSVSLWLGMLVLTARITIGSFQLYLRTLRSAQSNLSELVSSILQVYENYIFVSDLVWFLNLTPHIQESEVSTPFVLGDKTPIVFENVWFKYKKKSKWILKNLNLTITPGQRIAIVGENGAGKSTLIKLLSRFYDPQKGRILIGDKDLRELNINSWKENLAILFQRFETYPFSARESIAYGDISRLSELEDIKHAARKTDIDEYIEGLPLEYDNPLTPEFEKGVMPSVGQWQRIGISRILFRKRAGMLILDEPTSNVDPEAEEKIFTELMHSTDKTILFVTQRFSTARNADQIWVVEKGQIVEMGTHTELMKKHGIYARLFKLQAKGYN